MALSDKRLKELINSGRLVIDPLGDDTIRENGLDLKIGREMGVHTNPGSPLDITGFVAEEFFSVIPLTEEGVIVDPMRAFLLHTEEYLRIPPTLTALCQLRSTFARLGFLSPPTIVDAGFEGQLTIEVFWTGKVPVKIYPGLRFLHIVFFDIPDGVERPYRGSYQGQTGVRLPKSLEGELVAKRTGESGQ